jgi:mannose-1-phosphate guanylyltransferase
MAIAVSYELIVGNMEANSPTTHHPLPIINTLEHTYCIIMAGGRGERFWPFSADSMPKPFLRILGTKTMIQLTVERVNKLLPMERIFIILGKSHVDIAKEQLPDLPAANFIVEPEGRDTAPCIGFAAISLLELDPQAVMIVLPADHFIPDSDQFVKTVSYGTEIATRGDYLVTIGIKPGRPETGYGYINAHEPIFSSNNETCYKVERFVEKPDAHRAQQYLAEGNYFWNAGMFIWKVKTVLAGIAQHMPELYSGLLATREVLGARDEGRFAEIYSSLARKSIDYGLMEKADNVLMIPGGFIWDDVGTWSSLLRVRNLDENGNYSSGDNICIETKNSVICSDGLKVGVIGVSNMVIVASRDGVLVCDADRAQDVREIARLVEAKKGRS